MSSGNNVKAEDDENKVLGRLLNPTAKKVHETAEAELLDLMKSRLDGQVRGPIQIIHKIGPKELPYWGRICKTGNEAIIPHYAIHDVDSSIQYEECNHDVAAIHWDVINRQPNKSDWESHFEYLQNKINALRESIANRTKTKERVHSFKLLIFSDFEDLEKQILDLSRQGELKHPDADNKEPAELLGFTSTIRTDYVCLRSLSLLLPEGDLDGDINLCSAYFLNLMKPDSSMREDFCDYSSSVFSVSENKQGLLGNFFNYLEAFVFSSLSYSSDDVGIRTSTRIRPIALNSSSRHSKLISSAFSTLERGDGGNAEHYVNCHLMDLDLGKTFSNNNQAMKSSFYGWLNQYNHVVYNNPIDDTDDPFEPSYSFRSFTDQVDTEFLQFYKDSVDEIPQWKDFVDKKLNGGKIKTANQAWTLLNKLDEATRQDILNNLEDKPILSYKFDFYSRIVEHYIPIREKVQKTQHTGEFGAAKDGKSHNILYTIHHIEIKILTLGSIVTEVKKLANIVCEFFDLIRYPGITQWTGFKDGWQIYRRSGGVV